MRKRSRERIRVLLDSWSLQLIIDYLYSILWYAERVNVFDFESNDYLTIASGSVFCLLLASGFFHISWATPYGLLMFKWSFFISLCVWPMTHCNHDQTSYLVAAIIFNVNCTYALLVAQSWQAQQSRPDQKVDYNFFAHDYHSVSRLEFLILI